MNETIIDAKTARRLTKQALKKRKPSKNPKNLKDMFVKASEIEFKPIRQEDYEVDWGKAIKDACKRGIGCTQVWAKFALDNPTLGSQITEEMESLGYDFYHHQGNLYRIRWM